MGVKPFAEAGNLILNNELANRTDCLGSKRDALFRSAMGAFMTGMNGYGTFRRGCEKCVK